MQTGDYVKFKSKNASKDFRTLQRGQEWDDDKAENFAWMLKKDPFAKMEIRAMTEGFDMLKNAPYPVAILTTYAIPVPCSLLVIERS